MFRRKSISFPTKLHDEIERLAEENNRSFTRQVIWMLTQVIEQKLVIVVKDETDASDTENI